MRQAEKQVDRYGDSYMRPIKGSEEFLEVSFNFGYVFLVLTAEYVGTKWS